MQPTLANVLGIEKGEVHQLAEHLGLGKTEVLHVLGMEPSTFSRRRGRLTRIESEKVLLMAAVAAEGLEAFGNDEKAFHRWFRQPNILLDDKTPMDSCRFTFGIREVEKLLARIRTADFIA